jgi:DNA modification methylase
MIDLIHGDCLEKMKDIPDGSIDAVVTDPPYGLAFMGKHWDKGVPGVEFWREMIRVLKPGGYLVSFGGTRTYHRMAVAIEDAGFEIRDMIEWVYGSGFPKSLNIGKAVDKWEGWGTALKPAHEPICMARKPLAEKTVAENCLKWGVGGINIDESRVEYTGQTDPRTFGGSWRTDKAAQNVYEGGYEGTDQTVSPQGRFPANLIHDGSEEVRACFPENTSRFFKSIIYTAKASKAERNKGCEGLEEKVANSEYRPNDDGTKGIQSRLHGATKKGTNFHPTVKPVALMEYLINMVTREGGVVLDPFMGSGTTGVACVNLGRSFTGIELDSEYFTIAVNRLRQGVLPF